MSIAGTQQPNVIDSVQERNHDRCSDLIDGSQRQRGLQLGRFRGHPDDVDGPVEQRCGRHLDLEVAQDGAFDREPTRIPRKRLRSQQQHDVCTGTSERACQKPSDSSSAEYRVPHYSLRAARCPS